MRDTLFIHLGTLPDGASEWMRVSDEATGTTVERGALEEAGRQCAGCRVVVLVPGEDVTLARAVIPARNRQRVLAALPYVLEDRLIPDVETLHFAPGMRESGGALCAAVIERAHGSMGRAPARRRHRARHAGAGHPDAAVRGRGLDRAGQG
ncbi:MAG: hypothetical protein IPM20_10020 [Gammaproteobacteria bacterium]|nr:hypothetical protein [Gammaproteobacteria bacterium]